jgi:hypothetical protein
VPKLSPRRWQNAGKLKPLACHSSINPTHSAAARRTLAMIAPPRSEHPSFHHRKNPAREKMGFTGRTLYGLNSHDPDFDAKARAICQLYIKAPTMY